jgi:hypothetical protein
VSEYVNDSEQVPNSGGLKSWGTCHENSRFKNKGGKPGSAPGELREPEKVSPGSGKGGNQRKKMDRG